jgi:hypothetical protein
MTRRRGLQDVRASRPKSAYRKDGTLDPREWKIACSAAGVIRLIVLAGQPWFVEARPVEIPGKGVELEVVVRWLSRDVWCAVPAAVDGYPVNVVLDAEAEESRTVH